MIVCRTCGRSLPEEAYYTKTSKTVCYECVKKRQAEYQRQIAVKSRMAESRKRKAELKKIEEEQKAAIKKANENTCKKDCKLYPCFRGIDNCKINLALTCIKFKSK